MAGVPAVIGAYIALVGPLTTAITQIIELSNLFPISVNIPSGSSPSAFNNQINVGVGLYKGGTQDSFDGDGVDISGFTSQGTFIGHGKMPHMDPAGRILLR